MLQLATGNQHKGVRCIGPLVGGDDVGRHQFDAATGSGEVVDEHGRCAGIVFAQARIGNAGFTLQPLPGDARNSSVHGAAHFVIDGGHAIVLALVIPGQTYALGQVLQYPQIGAGLAGRVQGLLAQLHHAVGIAHRAGFLRPGGSGQHHIGQPGGFGHENILHYQVFQAGQGMARVIQVRVAHGGVFPHDVHAANLVRIAVLGQRFTHDFDHGVARLVVQLGAPEVFKPGMRGGVVHALVVGEHHRNQARV